MQSITQNDFERLLMSTSKAQFVSVATVTEPAMRKTQNPYVGNVHKVTFARGVINWRYQSSVRRQQSREGKPADFKACPRQWGTRISNAPLVSHVPSGSGETLFYLELKLEAATTHFFRRDTNQKFTQDERDELEPFLQRRKQHRQGVDRPVVLRDYRLDHIAEMTMQGIRYSVAPAAAALQTYFPTNADANAPGASHKRQPASAGAI